jgi:preprotein translocase subunit YajC
VLQHFTVLMSQPSQDGGPGLMSNIILFGSIILIFYFMIIRPQQKRAKDRQKLLESVKKGDKVITASGIYGTIAGLDEKTLLVQIADNVKVKLDRGSIATIISEPESDKKIG